MYFCLKIILPFKFPDSLDNNNSFVPISRPSVISLSDVNVAIKFSARVNAECKIIPLSPTITIRFLFSEYVAPLKFILAPPI